MSRRSRNRNRFGKARFRGDSPGARTRPINANFGATNRTSGPPERHGSPPQRLPTGDTSSRAPAGPRNRRAGRADVSTPPWEQQSRSGPLPPGNHSPALRHEPGTPPWEQSPPNGSLPADNRNAGFRHRPDGSIDPNSEFAAPGDNGAQPYPGQPPWHSPQSQYRNVRPNEPPNSIRDVDIDYNWFTPFQPVWPFGPPFVTYPREWDYPVGVNLEYIPRRLELFSHLQLMSRSNGILRSVIERRKDQFIRVPWEFQLKDQAEKKDKRIDELKAFFRKPDGKHTFQQWIYMLLEDQFVIDAPTVYRGWRRRDGKPYVLEIISGATIKPLIDDAGRIPDYPSPAYQQIIKGLPMVNFWEWELLYSPMRPIPSMPIYGTSNVEMIMLEATQAIRRLIYQVDFWNQGSIPDVWAQTPEDWTPKQVATFQALHDSLYGGNLSQKSKVRFMPGGVSPSPVKGSAGDLLKSEYDEWLARIICFTFGMSPQPFVRELNRATAETSKETAEEEGLHPLMTWFKESIMDRILYEDFGYDDIEFAWKLKRETDIQKQATSLSVYVRSGIMKPNEARDQIGLAEVPEGDTLIVETGAGGVPLEQIAEGLTPGTAAGAVAAVRTAGPNSGGVRRDGSRGSAADNAGARTRDGTRGAPGQPGRKQAKGVDVTGTETEAAPEPEAHALLKKNCLTPPTPSRRDWKSY